MNIANDIKSVRGNGKRVWIAKSEHIQSGQIKYFCGVDYDGEPELNFDEVFTTLKRAKSFFNTWQALAA